MKTKIEQICQEFFKLMKIQVDSVTVKCEDEERNIYYICLETPDSKLVIGTHGQTLESVKHILSRMIENSIGAWVVIHVEVNDYLKSKDDRIYRYIDSRIEFVIKSQKEVVLPNYSSYERKKIHSYISDKKLDTVRAYSMWEWKDRVMHLAPISKAPASDIDIDGTDI